MNKLIALCLAISLAGCATAGMAPGATLGQKLGADAAAIQKIAQDIRDKCPKMAPIAGLISKALAIAATPADVVSDVLEAVSAIPDLKQDYDAVSCAVKTALDDYKAIFKRAPSPQVAAKVAQLERALVDLGWDGQSNLCAVSQ